MKYTVIVLSCTSLFALSLHAEKPDPKSLQFSKWTPDFIVPDPVAIAFDDLGRAFVTQTQRRKANDLDIRANRDWIPDDLSFKTPDDKRAFYHKKFTPENSDANKRRVKDFNKDGKHDLADLKALTERIHLIEDTDGNGLADKMSLYAEDFTDEIGGIAAGVLHHEGDVYTTIVPDVWKLRDTDGDGKADERESIAYGFGVHLAYAGHDMHGLTVGPDGRIYWSIGDKGVGVTSKEGLHFNYPNQGAVLRCEPDGSNFEVYARGLRNVQEIAFDQYGNMFGVDNDSDRPGEKERFVYIVQHMDAGWRSNWQYVSYYNPWMDENLSVPYRKDQPAYIIPPISLYNDGPAGMAFNPGTALNEKWKNYFFHTSAPNGQQWAFQVEQDGASFKMVNDMKISNGVPIVGINFGPDGALYGVDWGGGYPLNEKGAVWKWDVKDKHPLREETAELLKTKSSSLSIDQLVKALGHADQRVRLKAQFELVKRNARAELEKATKSGARLSRIHAIWGICQLDRIKKSSSGRILELLNDPDAEIRAQVLRTYSENFGVKLALHQAPEPSDAPFAFEEIEKCLQDKSDQVKFHAAMALGNFGANGSEKALVELARSIDDRSKIYLRHAIIVGLTGCAPTEFLAGLAKDPSEFVQTVAVVALRRRGSSAVAEFLSSPHESVVAEAARAIHDDWTIPEALPALAASLESTPWVENKSVVLRAINANYHLGKLAHAQRIASFSTNSKSTKELRLDALNALSTWSEPGKLDRIVGRYRPLPKRDSSIVAKALTPELTKLLTDPDLQSNAMNLARKASVDIPSEALLAIAQDSGSSLDLKIEALRSLHSEKHPKIGELLIKSLEDSKAEIRIESLALLAKSNPTQATAHIGKLLSNNKRSLTEKQSALSLLTGTLASKEGDKILTKHLSNFDSVPAGLQLDLAKAGVARKLSGPAPDFAHTLEGGDAKRGEKIFMNHIAAQCIRCHKVKKGKGSDIGPNLQSVGREHDRAHLLESLLEPQKVITDGYGTISLTMKDGSFVAGQFRKEDKGLIELRDADNKTKRVKASDVKERSPVVSTMPPMGVILKKHEIRDLIEYLASLNVKK